MLMKTTLSLFMLLLLAACGGVPQAPLPPRLQAAQAAVLAANRAAQSGADADASAYWREAVEDYASIDDWAGQGEARLGLAQSLTRQGQRDSAAQLLAQVRSELLYPSAIRARAAYQQALLALDAPEVASRDLADARALCGADCPWQVQFDNLDARLTLARGDYAGAAKLLAGVLDSRDLPVRERAHALRLSAEVALHNGDLAAAHHNIEEVIALDRGLAEPTYLVDDYVFLGRYAKIANDPALADVAARHLQSLCSVFIDAACPEK